MNAIQELEVEFGYVKSIGGHPVLRFLDDGCREVEAKGLFAHADVCIASPNLDMEAVFAFTVDRQILSAMSFETKTWNRTLYTGWAYTLPEFRKQGLISRIIRIIEHRAAKEGCVRVCRITNVRNIDAQKVMEAQGYVAQEITYSKRIVQASTLVNNSE